MLIEQGPRTWIIATGIFAVCFGLIFICNYEFDFQPGHHVWGRVTYDGRAMASGSIAFAASDGDLDAWIAAPLDEEGRYSVDLGLIELKAEHVPTRVSIVPHQWSRPALATDVGARAHFADKTDAPFPEKLTHPATSGLEVVLTRQPMRIDFHLKSDPPTDDSSAVSNSGAAPAGTRP